MTSLQSLLALAAVSCLLACDARSPSHSDRTSLVSPAASTQVRPAVHFMQPFYVAYKESDWTRMQQLSSIESRLAEIEALVFSTAELYAAPGMRDGAFAWSADDYLGAASLVRIAFAARAASLGHRAVESATWLPEERVRIIEIGNRLIETASGILGSTSTPPPIGSSLTEARDKLNQALGIATLLRDPTCIAIARTFWAWLDHRTGTTSPASLQHPSVPWPPIVEGPAGTVIVRCPP